MYKKPFWATILCVTMLLALIGSAYAISEKKTIEIEYSNIQIELHGEKIVPKDAAGNIVEPFAYQGTTYLPVRAVGEAFGLEVNWDGTTHTVVLKDSLATTVDEFNSYVTATTQYFAYGLSHFPNIAFLSVIDSPTDADSIISDAKKNLTLIVQNVKEMEEIFAEVKTNLIIRGCEEEKFSSYNIFLRLSDLSSKVEDALTELETMINNSSDGSLSIFLKKSDVVLTTATELMDTLLQTNLLNSSSSG